MFRQTNSSEYSSVFVWFWHMNQRNYFNCDALQLENYVFLFYCKICNQLRNLELCDVPTFPVPDPLLHLVCCSNFFSRAINIFMSRETENSSDLWLWTPQVGQCWFPIAFSFILIFQIRTDECVFVKQWDLDRKNHIIVILVTLSAFTCN